MDSGKKSRSTRTTRGEASASASSSGRVTRSSLKKESTDNTAERAAKATLKRKAGYSQPTKSTLRKKAQLEAGKAESTVSSSEIIEKSARTVHSVRKATSPDSRPPKKAKLPSTASTLTSSSVETRANAASEQPEPNKILSPRDLGPGYLQYLAPSELALYRAYRVAGPEERLSMVVRGEVDEAEVEKAFVLEHIFDHLPVPGKDFDPVESVEGPEMYLEPGLRELFLTEKQKKLSYLYLDHQPFTFDTRTRVVDMMAGKLAGSTWRRDTFLLAVNLLDTVLSRGEIRGNELVVYSLACIQIAVKLNERYLMGFNDLVSSASETITKEKMERAEMNILNFLEFDLYGIPSHQFLIRINHLDKFNKPLLTMAKYLLEVSLYDLSLVTELPSKVAAACYALARCILVDACWSPSRHYYSGYSLEELEPLIETLIGTVQRLPIDSNIFPHYNSDKRYFSSDRVHSVLCPNYMAGQGFRS